MKNIILHRPSFKMKQKCFKKIVGDLKLIKNLNDIYY